MTSQIYSQVSYLLNHLAQSTQQDQQNQATSIFQFMMHGNNLPAFLNEIANDPALVARMIRYSYTHPNGFRKYMLVASDEPGYRLRLHVWKPLTVRIEGNLHDHPRDFWSQVLIGELIDVRYAEVVALDPRAECYYKYRSKERNDAEQYNIDWLGHSALIEYERSVIGAGQRYSRSYDLIHKSIARPNVTTVTLFIQGPAIREYAYVYNKSPIDLSRNARPLAYSETQYIQELDGILSLIHQKRDLAST
jgi:hypothetical protein